ncbi:GGDEF domain-containing protein [Geomesophilobacter sediminis]|uniref:diguanylate cyclase n=1 Tax=Geomesophilobacter sediminis TaxID=2798584 RepID=A0A8J7IPB1_9BACT|nr:diguanylate cyclase [Geomesophilobacter sediminis]MBJ6724144.1 diguanylate cyclase [Geomesophilobacter sediminis]
MHLLFCENYRREVLSVLGGRSGFEGVTASFFPGRCGIPPLTREDIARSLPDDAVAVEIVGDSCLREVADGSPGSSCRIYCVTPCLALFFEREFLERCMARGAYLITPGWLAKWRERTAVWGFDREALRAFFKEAIRMLVLLDTGVESDSAATLQEFAAHVDLPATTIPVGLNFFSRSLRIIVLSRRLELEKYRAEQATARLRQKSSDYAMALDLLGKFSTVHEEPKTIRLILQNFDLLFAPQILFYLCYEEGVPVRVYSLQGGPRRPDKGLIRQVVDFDGTFFWDENGSGLFRVSHDEETFGVIVVGRIRFPEYGELYCDLALSVLVPICELSIASARNYQRVRATERALNRVNRELKRLAATDTLTMIANRRRFNEYLKKEWRRAFREKWAVSLIMIDVDHFKDFNDTYGHQEGDACLRTVADIITGCISRAADLVARYGGEEFALILPNTKAQGAVVLAEKIRTAMERARIEHSSSAVAPYLTLSLGVASLVPDGTMNGSDLVAGADRALYRAKRLGRNRVVADKPARPPRNPDCHLTT